MTSHFQNVTGDPSVEVFTYSVFYVFYEQYLTIVNDAIMNLSICILAVTIITMLMLGKGYFLTILEVPWKMWKIWQILTLKTGAAAGVCVAITISLIIINLMGVMVVWDISLNAVSLVNLVMATGIAVEFCAHIARSFAKR